MTSNLGAAEIMKNLQAGFGFSSAIESQHQHSQLERIAMRAVCKCFSPEFVNRLDAVITYGILSADALRQILEQQIQKLQKRIDARFPDGVCCLNVTEKTKKFLLERADCEQYGARELNRVTHRHVTQPLAAMITRGEVGAVSHIVVDVNEDHGALSFHVESVTEVTVAKSKAPVRIGFSFAGGYV